MEKYIDKLASFVKKEDFVLADLTIVLPSQRAKKYLQRALFKVYGEPIFSPNIITMDRWVKDSCSESIIDPTRGLFKLYSIHQKINPQEDKGLDEFMKWGKTLLSDFDEIDRYLINYKDLFKNLADIKEIENWSFNTEEELTAAQKRFMAFWDMLPQYYVAYNKLLEKEEVTYMGKAYKQLAHNIDLAFLDNNSSKFIFAGFNALSPAETSIMKQLQKMGRATIFIDADEFYLNDKNHEAGSFLRTLAKELNTTKMDFTQNSLLTKEKRINIINCTQSTGQAKVGATILKEEIPQKELSETLLLLADERLVVPVIKNIPNTVEKTNITLGLPLKNTAIRSWVDLLFRVQENYRQFNTKSIYHKDFIRFIKHPFVLAFIDETDKIALAKVEHTILDKNWLFISPKQISCSENLKTLMDLTFQKWNDKHHQTVLCFREVNKLLYKFTNQKTHAIEKAVIYHFDQSLVKLQNVVEEFKPEISLKTFKTLFTQHWVNETIAYYGNPLDGLQVMGLLETRLLDFKNMIVVGLNDGKMPPGNPIQTLIPMDLRRFHGMPTPREKQGLFAHHFYRLLHTVENCWITFSSAHGSMGVDEPSRYIQQLKLELSRQNKKIDFKESFYTISDEQEDSGLITVEKTPAVISRLDEYFTKSTSASALRTFISCPLDFYYKYVLGFGEEDDVEEDIEASTFGSFIHNTLEELFRPYAQYDKEEKLTQEKPQPVSVLAIDKMAKAYPDLLKKDFEDHYKYNKEVLLSGKNYLSYEIANHLTGKMLKAEKKLLSEEGSHLFIDSLESEFSRDFTVLIDGKEKTIRFKGIIDRIDRFNNELRIIDYKSGKCDNKNVTITSNRSKTKTDLEHLTGVIKAESYVFQLLLYNFLYKGKYNKYPDKTGIISLINVADGPFYLVNNLTTDINELMDLFEQALTEIIISIYNQEEPFEHGSKSLYCDYCE